MAITERVGRERTFRSPWSPFCVWEIFGWLPTESAARDWAFRSSYAHFRLGNNKVKALHWLITTYWNWSEKPINHRKKQSGVDTSGYRQAIQVYFRKRQEVTGLKSLRPHFWNERCLPDWWPLQKEWEERGLYKFLIPVLYGKSLACSSENFLNRKSMTKASYTVFANTPIVYG